MAAHNAYASLPVGSRLAAAEDRLDAERLVAGNTISWLYSLWSVGILLQNPCRLQGDKAQIMFSRVFIQVADGFGVGG